MELFFIRFVALATDGAFSLTVLPKFAAAEIEIRFMLQNESISMDKIINGIIITMFHIPRQSNTLRLFCEITINIENFLQIEEMSSLHGITRRQAQVHSWETSELYLLSTIPKSIQF